MSVRPTCTATAVIRASYWPVPSAHLISTMLDLDSDLLLLRPCDRVLLAAYLDAEEHLSKEPPPASASSAAEELEEAGRWVTRIREVDGVPPDRIAPSHGRLIALGLLQFQLVGRDSGVVYRPTAAGRAALAASDSERSAVNAVRQSA